MNTILTDRSLKKISIALSIYLTSLLAANTLGLKIMPFLFGSHLSVAVLSFPVVFLMTDVIGEAYGKRTAKLFVLAGFISTVLFIAYSLISLTLPWSTDGLWAHDSYNEIFGLSIRMAIASIAAFGIAEYQDVFAFFLFKKIWGDRLFWLRSFLSNVWSQLLDAVTFMVIAFFGVYPLPILISIIITWWVYKVLMGVLYTPLLYVGLWLLKDKQKDA